MARHISARQPPSIDQHTTRIAELPWPRVCRSRPVQPNVRITQVTHHGTAARDFP